MNETPPNGPSGAGSRQSCAAPTKASGTVVETDLVLSLFELCHACGVHEEQVRVWVVEGVLEPAGEHPHEWRFAGASLHRARLAARLSHDLELDSAGVALALDLMDEIAELKARLQRSGAG